MLALHDNYLDDADSHRDRLSRARAGHAATASALLADDDQAARGAGQRVGGLPHAGAPGGSRCGDREHHPAHRQFGALRARLDGLDFAGDGKPAAVEPNERENMDISASGTCPTIRSQPRTSVSASSPALIIHRVAYFEILISSSHRRDSRCAGKGPTPFPARQRSRELLHSQTTPRQLRSPAALFSPRFRLPLPVARGSGSGFLRAAQRLLRGG